ncbi:hypothetical protein NQ028_06740 [Corynebacterium phoceense]|uniref:DUF7448 domain-containing protein n=1 Tax=Corynebacterium phoceense TaxID=1686286 RepID=UPI00211C8963|nr:hypothetical protein [Corynebacterium phoceense]MCQ9340840.1 hypothetical protein [Corynebacterium phoceense]
MEEVSDKAVAEFKKRIVGQTIKEVNEDSLVLDNGTVLELYESDQDCCAGAWAEFKVLDANNLHAGVTDVDFSCDEWGSEDDYDDSYGTDLTITILHNQNPIAQGECTANAGISGYYFSILSLRVKVKGEEVFDDEILSS